MATVLHRTVCEHLETYLTGAGCGDDPRHSGAAPGTGWARIDVGNDLGDWFTSGDNAVVILSPGEESLPAVLGLNVAP